VLQTSRALAGRRLIRRHHNALRTSNIVQRFDGDSQRNGHAIGIRNDALRDALQRGGIDLGHTDRTSGSMRQPEELSTTIAPALAAIGLNSRLIDDGVLERTRSMPLNASA